MKTASSAAMSHFQFDLKDEATTTQCCVDARNTDTTVTYVMPRRVTYSSIVPSQAYVECMFSLCGLVNAVRCNSMRDVNIDV